jgi:hypothetical protein
MCTQACKCKNNTCLQCVITQKVERKRGAVGMGEYKFDTVYTLEDSF